MSEVYRNDGASIFRDIHQYREYEPNPRLVGNQMALVLPVPMERNALYGAIARLPEKRPANFGELPLELRQERVEQINNFFQPHEVHFDATNKVIRFARAGMENRNPANPLVQKALLALANGKQAHLGRLGPGGGAGLGLVVIGPSGVGKSTFIDQIELVLGDKTFRHHSLGNRPCMWLQLPVIRVNVSQTLKEVLRDILAKIDEKYGRSHLAPSHRNSSVGDLRTAAKAALAAGFAVMLILDEFQRLRNFKRENAESILRALVDLMEVTGVPVVLVGTPVVEEIFAQYPQEMAKFTNEGIIRFSRLKEGDQDSKDYVKLLLLHFASKTKPQLPENFTELLLAFSGRLHRFAREYVKVILMRHSRDESIVIDEALLDDISKNEMSLFQPALEQIRLVDLGLFMDADLYRMYEHYLSEAEHDENKTERTSELEAELRSKSLMAGAQGKVSMSAPEYLKHKAGLQKPWTPPEKSVVAPFPSMPPEFKSGSSSPAEDSGAPRRFSSAKAPGKKGKLDLSKPNRRATAPKPKSQSELEEEQAIAKQQDLPL